MKLKRTCKEVTHLALQSLEQPLPLGDRIAVLSRLRRPAAGVEMAVMHLLRFEGGRIIELWDVGQQVPADSPNALGPF